MDTMELLEVPLVVRAGAHLGIRLKGGHDSQGGQLGIHVADVVAGGVAQRDGRIQPGDRIVSVNGQSLQGVSNMRAVEVLREASQLGQVKLVIARGAASSATATPITRNQSAIASVPTQTSRITRPDGRGRSPGYAAVPAASRSVRIPLAVSSTGSRGSRGSQPSHLHHASNANIMPPTLAPPQMRLPAAPLSARSSRHPVTDDAQSVASSDDSEFGDFGFGSVGSPPREAASMPPAYSPARHVAPDSARSHRSMSQLTSPAARSSTSSTVAHHHRQLPHVPTGANGSGQKNTMRSFASQHSAGTTSVSTAARKLAAGSSKWPPGTIVMELPTSPQGLGVTVVAAQGSKHAVRVQTVVPGGVAERDGRIQVGDALVGINGHSLQSLPAHEVFERLGAARGTGSLQPETLVLQLNSRPAGLSFAADDFGRVRISTIVPGSAADSSTLSVGAEVVSINNQAVRNAREAKRMIMKIVAANEDLVLATRNGRVELAVLPRALADADQAGDKPYVSHALITEGDGDDFDVDEAMEEMLPFENLLAALLASYPELSLDEEAQIRELARPNGKNMVYRRTFDAAVDAVLGGSALSSAAPLTNSTSGIGSLPAARRTAARFDERYLHALEEIEDLKQQLAASRRNQHLSTEAQQKSRRLEKDYDEVVALLEAEIAHLRAQLRAGPDEKDRQLINLRRRVLVLGAQLNKSAQSRRTLELGLGRLQELVNRTMRRLVETSTAGPRFPDKALSLKDDNTLRYRPSDGPLPPTAPWAVGDVCRAPSLDTGELLPAVIERLEPNDIEPGVLDARVRFLQYDDLPVVEVVTTDVLQPLADADFAVAAVRQATSGLLSPKDKDSSRSTLWLAPANHHVKGTLTPSERAIFEDCRATLDALALILENDVLPFGWEEAYTADGVKYYIDHTTQTTSWTHPVHRIDKQLSALTSLAPSSA